MSFKPTALYIKTHNITGKKYFGKTIHLTRVHSYKGSGVEWKKHLKEHGCSYTTELFGIWHTKERLLEAALKFSRENNIVNSDIWLNKIEERGIDGRTGALGPMSESQKEKIGNSLRGRAKDNSYLLGSGNPFFGKRAEETPNYKGAVIATNIQTGHQIILEGNQDKLDNKFDPSKISKCLRGERHTHKGHTFKYKEQQYE